jgi:hypothetical protein
MNRARPISLALLTLPLLSACTGAPIATPHDHAADLDSQPLNHVQFIGSHNSFKRAPQPELRELIRPFYGSVDEINYNHLSLTDQLNLGLRNLELDVYYDPIGGSYVDPMGNRMLVQNHITPWPRPDADELKTPGFKVLHDADFDFRTCHIAFEHCLTELAAWSDAHQWHSPVVITMNTKQGEREVPGAAKPAEFDTDALKRLDATVHDHLGAKHLITPDNIRRDHATLREAVAARAWPTLDELRGRFLFVLDEGDPVRGRYLAAFPQLNGAAYFVDVSASAPEAGIMVINDPVKDEAKIRDLVTRGFLVRTRADADTHEARTNDRSRFEAAMRSGAQIITTDYYIPDRSIDDRYMVRFEDGGFLRLNPVTGR